uniref:Uncharacterized protein n=1 Tax=Salix viminalis TaxID=40686 RepID=A0A6N2N9D4_SALVM
MVGRLQYSSKHHLVRGNYHTKLQTAALNSIGSQPIHLDRIERTNTTHSFDRARERAILSIPYILWFSPSCRRIFVNLKDDI